MFFLSFFSLNLVSCKQILYVQTHTHTHTYMKWHSLSEKIPNHHGCLSLNCSKVSIAKKKPFVQLFLTHDILIRFTLIIPCVWQMLPSTKRCIEANTTTKTSAIAEVKAGSSVHKKLYGKNEWWHRKCDWKPNEKKTNQNTQVLPANVLSKN